jgi:hypothetical protein
LFPGRHAVNLHLQIIKEFRCRIDACHQLMIPCTGASDVKQVAFRVVGAGLPAFLDEQLDLKACQQTHEENAKTAQREGDASYWPIYNLELRNLNGKATLEHIPSEDLVARMIANEREAAALLAEIAFLVHEVPDML